MHRLCALALLFAVGAVQAQDDAPAGDGEVLLQTERLDLLPWYVSVQGFAHVRRMKCTVTLAGNQGISIKGGTPEDRALLVKVATLFEAEGAGGSAPREQGSAPAEQVAEGLYARRTDFASAEDAQAAFPRVRALIASPLPEVRKLQVFLLGERLVVLGEPELGVYLLGGLADAIKASLPVRAPLGPWREECAHLAARFEAEGDAAYDWTFGGHMLYDDPLRDARTQLAIAESCARAAELYEQARGLRAAVGLEPPSDERAKVIAERLGFLARQAAGMFSKAADDLEAAGDADAAELARSKAKALGGE